MKLLFVVLAVLGWTAGFAERVYLLFEPDCGTVIEYERVDADATVPGAYYAHSLSLGNESTLLLESAAAGVLDISDLPLNYIRCGNSAALPSRVDDRINSGELQAFVLVSKQSGGYRQHPVLMAAIMTTDNNRVNYHSPLVTLTFNQLDVVIGQNLVDQKREDISVLFEGREGLDCASPYLFHQQNSSGAYRTIDLKLYPGVGIIERTLLPVAEHGKATTIRSTRINGQLTADYLLDRCRPQLNDIAYSDQQRDFIPLYVEPAKRLSTEPGAVESRAVPEDMAPASPPPATLPDGSTHTVRTGETLYGIARQHGTTVNDLKLINGLSANTIFIGQELRLGGSDSENSAQSEDALPQMTPEVTNTYRAPIRNQATYTVTAGETLADIAYRSGYTTERFAEINGLTVGAVLYPGQDLKTTHCECPISNPQVVVPQSPDEDLLPRPGDHIYYPPPPAIPGSMSTIEVPASPPAYGGEVQMYVQRPDGGLPGESRQVHTVREGENLYAIARQYSVTVAKLRELNGLSPTEVIVPYQELYLN